MYSVEYYKTKHCENEIDNIKSLTIDKEDVLNYIYYEYDNEKCSKYILSLFIRLRRIISNRRNSGKDNIKAIKILNNNDWNKELIQDIINTCWLVDKNKIDDLQMIETINKITSDLSEWLNYPDYTSSEFRRTRFINKKRKAIITRKKILYYYLDTIRGNIKEEDGVTIKLGR